MRIKLAFVFVTVVVLLVLAFVLHEDMPPKNPHGYEAISEPVTLNFRITRFNGNRIEMALTDADGKIGRKEALYAVFRVEQVVRKRVVALESMSTKSSLGAPENAEKKPDYPFLSDARGRDVIDFPFENQLTRGPKGETLMRMRYTGVPVPLIQELIIDETVTLPAFIKERFASKKDIRFGKGTYRFDEDVKGFWVNVPD